MTSKRKIHNEYSETSKHNKKNHDRTLETITSAGVIPYTIVDGEYYFMLQYSYKRKWYEDFGGKAEHIDKSSLDTAFRELVEETNASIFNDKSESKEDYLLCKENELELHWKNYNNNISHVSHRSYNYYNKFCKYKLYFVHIPEHIARNAIPSKFGDQEYEQNKHRIVTGVDFRKLKQIIMTKQINPRITMNAANMFVPI
jgi:hypothetical protein